MPLRAVANALLSAGNTTDLSSLQQPSVSSLVPTQAGAPVFPDILPARVLTTTLVNFTTMDRNLQNAYSRQASVEVERQLGARQHGQRRLPVPARREPDHVGQPERADVRRRRHQQRLPAEPGLREQQPVLVGGRVELSRAARVVRAAADATGAAIRVSYTLSKSMNNVGEAFFSSPIDPFDISRTGAAPTTTSGIAS